MDFYQPVLANWQRVPLPRLLIGYKINFLWPLRKYSSQLQFFAKYFVITFTLLSYTVSNFASFMYIYENINDISAVSECLSTFLMGIQFFIRVALPAMRQQEMQHLFERFYKEIYIVNVEDATLHRRITRIMRIIAIFAGMTWMPLIMELIIFPMEIAAEGGMSSNTKPFFFRMSFTWYDAQAPLGYIITTFYTGWIHISCSALMAADDYCLCFILIHTSYCYKKLQQDLRAILLLSQNDVQIVEDGKTGSVHAAFRKRLLDIFRRQQKLDSFVKTAKLYFTYQIFLCFSFGVVVLCNVCFYLQMTTISMSWLRYIFWFTAQSSQFIIIGYFGHLLLNESSAMRNSFYMCQWELILSHGDIHSNKLLMKDIRFAIMYAERGAVFNGIKMVPLTLGTTSYALQTAFSYFMFLNTINEANKLK